jgi:hypothetical protein
MNEVSAVLSRRIHLIQLCAGDSIGLLCGYTVVMHVQLLDCGLAPT